MAKHVQNPAVEALNMGGFKITSLPDGTATGEAVHFGQLASAGSKWTTSGSDIYRPSGNVGIGGTPTEKLSVFGSVGVSAGNAFKYNGANALRALTSINNWFLFGGGNMGATNTDNYSLGAGSLAANILGGGNIGIGTNTLQSVNHSNGAYNVALGYNTLRNGTSVNGNMALGAFALNASNADANVGIGYQALENITTGPNNLGIGAQAGRRTAGGTDITTASQSIFLGVATKPAANGNTNEIVIGYNAVGNGSDSVTLGADTIAKTILRGTVGIGTTAPSAALDVATTIRFRAFSAAGNLVSVSDANGNLTSVTPASIAVNIANTNLTLTASRTVTIPTSMVMKFDAAASGAEFRIEHSGGLLTRFLASGVMRRPQFTTLPSLNSGDEVFDVVANRPAWAVGTTGADIRHAVSLEEDIIGDGVEVITTNSAFTGGKKLNWRIDCSAAISQTLGSNLAEGRTYLIRVRSNTSTNTMTFNAESTYIFYVDFKSNVTLTTLVTGGGSDLEAANRIYSIRRVGTVIYIK